MYQVIISETVTLKINKYSLNYRGYFYSLYIDSGIWAEKQIISSYINESTFRVEEIYEILKTHFSKEIILWRTPQNTLCLPWRSKKLVVTWEEQDHARIIKDLEIK